MATIPLLPQLLSRGIADDVEEPRTEALRLTEVFQVSECLEKRMLQHIVHVAGSNPQSTGDGSRLPLIAGDQVLKGAWIVSERSTDQSGVGP